MRSTLNDLRAFVREGPHPVGLRCIEIEDPNHADRRLPVDVWYPATLSPAQIESEPDAEHPFNIPHAAHVDAAAATGAYPLVLFSHGNSGLRRQSTFLTTHLASWGIVVAAPDHAGNTFPEMAVLRDAEERKRVHLEARRNRPSDIQATADAVLAERALWPSIDPERIAALGHSFGGWTSLKMARRDARVRAICGMAPASEPFVGRKAFEPDELPFDRPLPSLLIAGIDDVLVDLETSVRPLFERLDDPTALVGIEGADHFHFCDSIPMLHRLHEKNPRPDQPRPTKPYADLLSEQRTHAILRALVTSFFMATFDRHVDDPTLHLSPSNLARLDPMAQRLD